MAKGVNQIRRLFTLGCILLAAFTLAADIDEWWATGQWNLILFGDIAFRLFPETLNIFQAIIQRYVWAYLWDPIAQTLLLLPVFPVLGTIGLGILTWDLSKQRFR